MFLKSPFFIFSSFVVLLVALLIKNEILEIKFSSKKLSQIYKKYFKKSTTSSSSSSTAESTGTAKSDDAPQLLKDHSKLFNKKEIVKVTEGVYSAIGFGLANCLLFDDGTDDGLVMVDAMESEEAMRDVILGFEQQHGILIEHAGTVSSEKDRSESSSSSPPRRRRINTLIYTHSHQDHVCGGKQLNAKNIVSHELTGKALTVAASVVGLTWGAPPPALFEANVGSGNDPGLKGLASTVKLALRRNSGSPVEFEIVVPLLAVRCNCVKRSC